MIKKKIFISFAKEDSRARDFLFAQAQNSNFPIEYTDMSVKTPWDTQWKTQCRQKIKSCDGVIAFLSTHTYQADGAKWEMQCAQDESIPMIGVHINREVKGAIPPQLKGCKVIEWDVTKINNFINSC